MKRKNNFKKIKKLLLEVEEWQFELEQLCSLELALSEVFCRGNYCVDTFAPAMEAIYQKAFGLNERMEKAITKYALRRQEFPKVRN